MNKKPQRRWHRTREREPNEIGSAVAAVCWKQAMTSLDRLASHVTPGGPSAGLAAHGEFLAALVYIVHARCCLRGHADAFRSALISGLTRRLGELLEDSLPARQRCAGWAQWFRRRVENRAVEYRQCGWTEDGPTFRLTRAAAWEIVAAYNPPPQDHGWAMAQLTEADLPAANDAVHAALEALLPAVHSRAEQT